jgi:hypothetical protein
VLNDAAAAGLTVLRCWAFCDGEDQWNALQASRPLLNTTWQAYKGV